MPGGLSLGLMRAPEPRGGKSSSLHAAEAERIHTAELRMFLERTQAERPRHSSMGLHLAGGAKAMMLACLTRGGMVAYVYHLASVRWACSCSRFRRQKPVHTHAHHSPRSLLTIAGHPVASGRLAPTCLHSYFHTQNARDLQSAATSHTLSRLGIMSNRQASDEQAVNKTTPSARRTRDYGFARVPIQTRHRGWGTKRTSWCTVCRHGLAIVRVDIKSYGPSTGASRIHKDLLKGEKTRVLGMVCCTLSPDRRLAV